MRIHALVLTLFILALACPATAHDFWAGTSGPGQDGRLTVFIGFGHNFPVGEEIDADHAGRYDPLKLIGPGGDVTLVPGAGPTSFATGGALPAGTYLAAASSKAGFSSRSPSGYVAKSKLEDPTITRCSYAANFGKAVVNVGGAADNAAASQVLGHKLEIVPSINPAGAKVGEPYPVKVLFDGQPLPRAKVEGYFAGFTPDNDAFAFSASTNREGEVSVIPLKAGQWLILTSHTLPYANQAECDNEVWGASLAITIAE